MKFLDPIQEGRLIKRYKRFFADFYDEKGEKQTAHVPNTGSMKGCLDPSFKVRVTRNDDPKRKLKFTLQMIKTKTSWVGVNTGLPNKLVNELYEKKGLFHWKKFDRCQGEAKINDKTRIDFVMWKNPDTAIAEKERFKAKDINHGKFHFVEVKNVTMAEGSTALFPDAVTTRGQKHLLELMDLMEEGHTCELVFTVQRTDCKVFKPAHEIDPEYGKLLKEAKSKGLKITVIPCRMTKTSISLDPENLLPVNLK